MGRGKRERETGRKFNWKERARKSLSDSKVAASWRDAFQFVKVARFWRPAIIVHLRSPTELSNRVSTHDIKRAFAFERHANKKGLFDSKEQRSNTRYPIFEVFFFRNRENEWKKEFIILTRGRIRDERKEREGEKNKEEGKRGY